MNNKLIKLTCKYKLLGIYNDLRKYLLNMLKFYVMNIIIIFGIIGVIVFCSGKLFTTEDINTYFNYILPIGSILLIIYWMFSNYTLIVFSKPDIFYLIRNRNLFFQIAIAKLFQQNISFIVSIIGISYAITYNIKSADFIKVLASLLLIVCALNLKYYIFNRTDSKKEKLFVILFFAIQLLHPNIYLIILEYILVINLVKSSFNNLNLERLIPLCDYLSTFSSMIKTNSGGREIPTDVLTDKNKKDIENIPKNNENTFFKFRRNISFFIKDYKSMKNRPMFMNVVLIALIIGFGILNIFFSEYKIILYVFLYLILNIQLKEIFSSNYYMLFNKVSLCKDIKSFINETSCFSVLAYLIINTTLLISIGKIYYSIIFIVLISINIALTSNYNALKNLKISIFNGFNILLVALYITVNNPVIIIATTIYSIILYAVLYKAIKKKINI